ncbi:MAG: response regulator [Candidatus Aureabacteria bacterium]|nr:response regulator [Candidatus Auribacterota bacterium]
MSGKVILIIDDAAALRFILSFDLRRKGYQTINCGSGDRGIELAKEKRPDLILLDIVLGRGMDGFETLKRLKAEEETKNIPVVMTTARSEREDMKQAMELGATKYLVKPFSFNELLAKITSVIGE